MAPVLPMVGTLTYAVYSSFCLAGCSGAILWAICLGRIKRSPTLYEPGPIDVFSYSYSCKISIPGANYS